MTSDEIRQVQLALQERTLLRRTWQVRQAEAECWPDAKLSAADIRAAYEPRSEA